MKVEGKLIIECFNEIKYILLGIAETMRYGDEGFEDSVLQQSEDIKTMINVFTLENMTPVVKEIVFEHKFLRDYEKNSEKTESWSDNQNLFKARLYLFIKRELRKIEIPYDLKERDCHNWIYDKTIFDSVMEKYFNTELANSGYAIINLLTKEIFENRRKYPQLSMPFEEANQQTPNKSLLHII